MLYDHWDLFHGTPLNIQSDESFESLPEIEEVNDDNNENEIEEIENIEEFENKEEIENRVAIKRKNSTISSWDNSKLNIHEDP